MSEQTKPSLGTRLLRFIMGLLFGVLIPGALLGAGIYGAIYLMETAPQAQRQSGPGEEVGRLIETLQIRAADHEIVVETMGLVTPARRVSIRPRVEGEIVSIHPDLELGGFIPAGEVLLELDASDYRLAILQAKAQVAQMESALRLEMGQQEVAREEFELLGAAISEDQSGLVLRQPQLDSAQANLDRARAALEAAELDLERTRLRAPFNSLVLEDRAETGAIAGRNEALAELVGTDRFWVELSVPVDHLRWVQLPDRDGEGGSLVRLFDRTAWEPDQYREGRVIRFGARVDEKSRMATLVVGVEDPLALEPENEGKPRLLLGSYVTGLIEGASVPRAIALRREHLRENSTVWVMNDENRLAILPVDVIWRGRTQVVLSGGLLDGERIVTSNLSAPVEGMKLRTRGSAEQMTNL